MLNSPKLSSIFVDFDNVFLCLRQQDPKLAEYFATQPDKWFGWLDAYLEQLDGYQRRINVRQCYLNPKYFGSYRPFFMKAGFEVVDCPALTAAGKTSADIRIAIDMLELVDFKATYDEFILLSADADFTPVMLKLRKCGCGTVLLAIGNSSPIYRASCDNVIDQSKFTHDALSEYHIGDVNQYSSTNPAKLVPPKAIEPVAVKTNNDEHGQTNLALLVTEHVRAAENPVTMAALAAYIRRVRPDIGPDWGGFVNFKSLINSLSLPELSLSNVGPSYMYAPDLHVAPGGETISQSSSFVEEYPAIAETAIKVSRLTDIPALSPDQYRCLFLAVAEEVNKNGFNMSQTSKNVRDRCKEADLPVARSQVNWAISAITYTGHRFEQHQERMEDLVELFYKNALNLCEKSFLDLTEEEHDHLRFWFAGPSHS